MIEKIDKIQALLNVPNVDADTETAIANMKILNLLVDLRAQAEQLNLSVVVPSDCNFYMSGMDTSSKCNNCGKPEHLH